MSKYSELKKINLNTFKKMKADGEKITSITAYDYTSAKILDKSGVEIILVGDSLGSVMNGYDNSIPVTLDEIIYHAKAVKRASKRAYLVADMPFGSYHVSDEQGLENAIRLVKETGFDAVKIEGGKGRASMVKKFTDAGIVVMGHIGLMPQMVHTMGGYKVQGRNGHEEMLEDAKALEEAGAFAIVIEGAVADVAEKISKNISIPTIGIGAGAGCDGQVLVYHDIFGLFDDYVPKFVKQYADVKTIVGDACKQYIEDVKASRFPAKEYTY
ncbi:3-methyl-2-oxobutanoatehydroxymethyltransferase [Denitrovibrio acetiphilus DSM 12809]|uniref:3-methyl-2-oxobutanoate hydroxymethyltransferase n=1 Tax=Denitrovibrio acetiphilus (strain DSM 12809 / NBRC 114555 / N2460) TaxID=522772 RepID=D4H852_DENA2|nr:3-methyl-2-oxobutanoate hydroxymethyltransferase [Denitrovibrio acetiphilus]ADD68201.1 3-methyl-2-oxobutanoatehydroxymethyltransferase [Denitrovibrio acetiphilus DSM 12809]